MTRYFVLRRKPVQSWKREAVNRKWRDLFAIFICVVLLFAAINGVLKSFSIKKLITRATWDPKSPFVAAVLASPPGLLVYTTEPKRVLLFKFNSNVSVISGKDREPLVSVSDVIAKRDGAELARIMSLTTQMKVDNFITIGEELNKQNFENSFRGFASLVTPAKIFIFGNDKTVGNTNITRLDVIRLWWQVKSLGLEELNLVDLSVYSQDVLIEGSSKVLGVDEASLHFEISKYVKNRVISGENFGVNIVNGSGSQKAFDLAINFLSGAGYGVGRVENSESESEETVIWANDPNSYGAKYLARVFDCDKISALKEGKKDELKVIIGRDFKRRYFE